MNCIEQQMRHAHYLLGRAENKFNDDWLRRTLQQLQDQDDLSREFFGNFYPPEVKEPPPLKSETVQDPHKPRLVGITRRPRRI